jgi:hypothetical protein
MLHVELLDEGLPCWPLYFCRKQVLILCNEEAALVRNQGGVREQESLSAHFHANLCWHCRVSLTFATLKQGRSCSQRRYRLQKRGSSRNRGIGLRKIRPVVQTRCISICSVTKISLWRQIRTVCDSATLPNRKSEFPYTSYTFTGKLHLQTYISQTCTS